MAYVIVSTEAERMIDLLEEQARYHVNLVRGAEKEVLSLTQDLRTIRNVMDDAENRRFVDKNINSWLSRLVQTIYDLDYVLDEWNAAVHKRQISVVYAPPKQKVRSFIPSSSCLGFKKVVSLSVIAQKLLYVKAQIDEILKERDRYGFIISPPTDPSPGFLRIESTPLIDLEQVVYGRDVDRDTLVDKLIMDNSSSRQEEFGIRVVSLVGVGGVGKTALARLVYNHSRVEEYFELRIWVCVSDPFDLVAISKGILGSTSPNTDDLDVLLRMVKESIYEKRFLLVLDDVWTEDYKKWEPLAAVLRCNGVGSKVLVTTRSERVARTMGFEVESSQIYHVALLSNEDCWLLVCHVVHSVGNEVGFEEIGKQIVKRCKGLPLAATILGGLLRFKSRLEEWEIMLYSEIWEMEKVEIDIFPHLLLSYNDLSLTLKMCFSHCVVFPRSSKIIVENLIDNWMIVGYLGSNVNVSDAELKGRECFNNLAMRCLFQDFEKDDFGKIVHCTMHDIVYDFCQFLSKSFRVNKSTICRVCDPSHVSDANVFFTLYCDKKNRPNLCKCLVRLRVLNLVGIADISQEDLKIIFQFYDLRTLSLRKCDLVEIPTEIENLIQLRRLELSGNKSLKELPMEIGNLVKLRRLDLSGNKSLKELPMEIGNLIHLRHLDLSGNESLEVSHESISGLRELKTFNTFGCRSVYRLYVRVNWTRLNGRSPNECQGRNDWSKLTSLENLNHLGRVLWLKIRLDGDINFKELVEDARAAELRNKTHIEELRIYVEGLSTSSVSMDVTEALQPHPNLRELSIWNYGGSKLPLWILSPVNQLRNLKLHFCNHLTSLPPLGKLPCLEEIHIDLMESLEIVGREFLGMTTGEGGAGDVVVFSKLKTLELRDCDKWTKWEDITEEEEKSAGFSVMSCLTELTITGCNGLTMLPHCLLRKASLLNKLRISGSTELVRRYGNEDDSIPINNPRLHLICYS